jgi:SRSO17 transposase
MTCPFATSTGFTSKPLASRVPDTGQISPVLTSTPIADSGGTTSSLRLGSRKYSDSSGMTPSLYRVSSLNRRQWVLPNMNPEKGLYWIIDDTGFPKKGKHSVGVARQYCGQLGKQDNCQVAVSLSVATEEASLPVAYQLYLPQDWADDPTRRLQAGVPGEIEFATKPQIAIGQLREARQSGAPDGIVLADAGYGNDTAFRDAVGEFSLQYAVGIQSSTRVWPPGRAPLPAEPAKGKAGRPRSLQRRVPGHDPVPVKDLALAFAPSCYHTVLWREGTRAALSSRFAALRVRASHRGYWRATPRDEEWLLIEWPTGEPEPTKYWLSTLPEDTPVERLVHVAKMRWRH